MPVTETVRKIFNQSDQRATQIVFVSFYCEEEANQQCEEVPSALLLGFRQKGATR